MILWITGISGSGKTTLGKYFFKEFKKKIKIQFFLMEMNLELYLAMI